MLGASPVLSVGILSGDWMDLGGSVRALEQCGVRALHFDVMDGRFVPQLTAGPCWVKGVKTKLLKDVHLMIEDPLPTLHEYVAAGADLVTVHVESCRHIHRVLQRLRELPHAADAARPVSRGVALHPSTPVSALEPLLDEIDLVLLVAINPGFASQSFLGRTLDRVARVREMVAKLDRRVYVGIDGGVNRTTMGAIAGVQPDLVVSGSAVFEGGVQQIANNVQFFEGALTTHAEPLVRS